MYIWLLSATFIFVLSLTQARNISIEGGEAFSNCFCVPSGERRLIEIAKKTAAELYKGEAGIREQVYPNGIIPVVSKDGKKFLHIKVKGDGDCALHSFGTTRPAVVKVLLNIVDNAQKSFVEHKEELEKQGTLSTILEKIKVIRSYKDIRDLVNLFNTDIASLKNSVQALSDDLWTLAINAEIEKIEAEIIRLRTEENLKLAKRISDLSKKISDENNKKKKEQDPKKIAQWLKEKEGIFQAPPPLKINFEIFEDAYEMITTSLKNNLPQAFNFYYFSQFINSFLGAINTRIESGNNEELKYLRSNAEQVAVATTDVPTFDNSLFDLTKKTIEAFYTCPGKTIDFADKKVNSRSEWFDAQLLGYIEGPLNLNVVVIDKTHGNEVRAKTNGQFDTEPRYAYYVGGHYELLIPLAPILPFPEAKTVSK